MVKITLSWTRSTKLNTLVGRRFLSTIIKWKFRKRRAIFMRGMNDPRENIYFCGGEKKILTKIKIMKIFIFV